MAVARFRRRRCGTAYVPMERLRCAVANRDGGEVAPASCEGFFTMIATHSINDDLSNKFK